MSKADPDPMRQRNELSPVKIDLEIITDNLAWNACDFDLYITSYKIIKIVLEHLNLGAFTSHVEISLLLADDDKLQELNYNFRHKDETTNVLSFPNFVFKAYDLEQITQFDAPHYLGDIAVSYNVLEKEAMDRGISLLDHFTHLIVHSVLHLLGFDHIKKKEEEKMIELEVDILKKFNINNPY